jgi:hypothetical protein
VLCLQGRGGFSEEFFKEEPDHQYHQQWIFVSLVGGQLLKHVWDSASEKQKGKCPKATLEIHPWPSPSSGGGRESLLMGHSALSNWLTSEFSKLAEINSTQFNGKAQMDCETDSIS